MLSVVSVCLSVHRGPHPMIHWAGTILLCLVAGGGRVYCTVFQSPTCTRPCPPDIVANARVVRLMQGQYASDWKAFLFINISKRTENKTVSSIFKCSVLRPHWLIVKRKLLLISSTWDLWFETKEPDGDRKQRDFVYFDWTFYLFPGVSYLIPQPRGSSRHHSNVRLDLCLVLKNRNISLTKHQVHPIVTQIMQETLKLYSRTISLKQTSNHPLNESIFSGLRIKVREKSCPSFYFTLCTEPKSTFRYSMVKLTMNSDFSLYSYVTVTVSNFKCKTYLSHNEVDITELLTLQQSPVIIVKCTLRVTWKLNKNTTVEH